jgi:hypothetical protein
MRGTLATLAGLVAVVALAVALPATWTSTYLEDEDGFVSLARDVTGTEAVRTSAAALVAERLVEQAGLPPQLAESGREVLEQAAERALADRGVTAAWEETLRRTHAAALADPPAGAPLAALVADRTEGLVQAPDELVVELPGGPSANTLRAVDASPRVALVASLVAAGAAAVALLAARRRSATLVWLGLGAVVAAGLDAALARLLRHQVVAESGAGGLQSDLVRALADVGLRSFDTWLVWTALAAAVAVVVGVVGVLVGRRP